jgi:hypothetical protein
MPNVNRQINYKYSSVILIIPNSSSHGRNDVTVRIADYWIFPLYVCQQFRYFWFFICCSHFLLCLRHYTSLRRLAGTYCPSVVKRPYLCSATFCFDLSVENDTLNYNRYIFCIGQ